MRKASKILKWTGCETMCVAFCLTTESFIWLPLVLAVLGAIQLLLSIKLYSGDYTCVTDEEYDELESVPTYNIEHYTMVLDDGESVTLKNPLSDWDEVYLIGFNTRQEEAV